MISFFSCLFPPPGTSKDDEVQQPHGRRDPTSGEVPGNENRCSVKIVTPTHGATPLPAVLATVAPNNVQPVSPSCPSLVSAPSFSLQQQLIGMQLQIKQAQAAFPWGRGVSSRSSISAAGATLASARPVHSPDVVASRVAAILKLGSTPAPSHRRDDRPEPQRPRSATARPKSVTDMQGPAGARRRPSQTSTLSGSQPSSSKMQALINSVRDSNTSRQPPTIPKVRSAQDLNALSGACTHAQLPAQHNVKASISICASGPAAKLLQLFPQQPLPQHAANPLQLQLALLQQYKMLQLQEDEAGNQLMRKQMHRSKSTVGAGSSSIVRRCVTQLPA